MDEMSQMHSKKHKNDPPAQPTDRHPLTPAQVVEFIERISDGFVAFDTQMNYTYVNQRGGDQLLLNLQGDTTNGYTGSMTIGLDLTHIEVGAADSMGSGGGAGGPGGPPPP